ncbi:hypothetical protein EK904_001880, partial [Melospiza melodia maxima]
ERQKCWQVLPLHAWCQSPDLQRGWGCHWGEMLQKLAAECQSAGYPGTLIPYKCDLSNEEEILSMFSAIRTLHQGVDVCINNAGLARPEPLLSGRTEGWRTMIDGVPGRTAGLHFLFSPPQVNVMAVSICTREAYQSMKERNIDDGHIININRGITNPIRMCSAFFQCISPGLVETGFAFKLHDNDPERAAATYESIRVGPGGVGAEGSGSGYN